SISYLIGLNVFGQTNGGGATSVLLIDVQLNSRLVTVASGVISTRLAFDAYGNLLGLSVGVLSPPPTLILFTGQIFDPYLVQYNLRARTYNPANGRFDARDSYAGDQIRPASLHVYMYTQDDPTNQFDPSGHEGELLESLIVTGIRVGLFALNFISV